MNERGQSIILVAVAIVALVAFVAIAVDGARLYVMRRQMQNAADAGALAGAYQLCSACSTCPKTQLAKNGAVRFALLNEAQDVTVSIRKNTVWVTARVTFPTYFAGMLKVSELSVEARAAAECKGNDVRLVE